MLPVEGVVLCSPRRRLRCWIGGWGLCSLGEFSGDTPTQPVIRAPCGILLLAEHTRICLESRVDYPAYGSVPVTRGG